MTGLWIGRRSLAPDGGQEPAAGASLAEEALGTAQGREGARSEDRQGRAEASESSWLAEEGSPSLTAGTLCDL